MVSDKVDYEHYIHHSGEVNPMATLDQLESLYTKGIHMCIACTLVFPNVEALILHCYFKNHTTSAIIYCGICGTFLKGTTTLSHHTSTHFLVHCNPCQSNVSLFQFLSHYLTPIPHSTHANDELLGNMPSTLHEQLLTARNTTLLRIQDPIDILLQVLDLDKFQKYRELLSSAHYFDAFLTNPTPSDFPRNSKSLITEESTFATATTLHAIITAIETNTDVRQNKTAFLQLRYELLQLIISTDIDQLLSYSTNISRELVHLLFYGPQAGTPVPVMQPLYIPNFHDLITTYDWSMVDACVIGMTQLRAFGTHPTSGFHLLNLSPPHQTLALTHRFATFGTPPLAGLVKLPSTPALPIWHATSYFCHIYDVIRNTPNSTLYIIEVDLSSIILKMPDNMQKPLSAEIIHTLLTGFFGNLKFVLNTLAELKGAEPNVVLAGQLPFLIPRYSPIELTILWKKIGVAILHLAHIFRVPHGPAYEHVGCSDTKRPQLVAETLPIFTLPSKKYSNKTNQQVLLYLKTLVTAHKKYISICN